MTVIFEGSIHKLKTEYIAGKNIIYRLGEGILNDYVGRDLKINFTGQINCVFCKRSIKKTFGDGYCFPCVQKLARCDMCIVRPEKCHYHLGTCREPEWGKENCLIKHAVYLAQTVALKIGITRDHQKFTRWADQGAVAAIVLFYTKERLTAGQVEVKIAKTFSDRTDWRGLLTGKTLQCDLVKEKQELLARLPGLFDITQLTVEPQDTVYELLYPVNKYLEKAVSLNLDKQPTIVGTLLGIRGQYLLFPTGGINMRKFQGYQVQVETI